MRLAGLGPLARLQNLPNIEGLSLPVPTSTASPRCRDTFCTENRPLDNARASILFVLATGHGANRGTHLVLTLHGEGAKVALADEIFSPAASVRSQAPWEHAKQCVASRIHHRMIPNRVLVLLAGRIEPCVKSHRHPFHFHHAHVVRQKGVKRQPDLRSSTRNSPSESPHARPCLARARRCQYGLSRGFPTLGNNRRNASTRCCTTPLFLHCHPL